MTDAAAKTPPAKKRATPRKVIPRLEREHKPKGLSTKGTTARQRRNRQKWAKAEHLTQEDLAKISEAEMLELMGKMQPREQKALLEQMQAWERADLQGKWEHYFPDETHRWRGETYHARELYDKHLDLFRAGAKFTERCFRAANRVGKTDAGAYEMSRHLTGVYPEWWEGRRFAKPIHAWVAGKHNETVRDILQPKLLGSIEGGGQSKAPDGTGLIPGDLLGKPNWRQGVADLIDTIPVKHASGGWSNLGFKSYQQGRGSFEGVAKHAIWFDEEPPAEVYDEALMRLLTTKGIMLLTFTPLEGYSEVVKRFVSRED